MATQFIEVEFPRTIAAKAMGGPSFLTTVNEGQSGFEQRNQNWGIARGSWTVSLETPGASANVDPLTYIEQLNAFFLVVGGKANAFRLKDHKDFTNGLTPVAIGVGTGSQENYQLVKNYTIGPYSYQRVINKPVTSRAVDYLNRALQDTIGITVNGAVWPKNAGYIGGGSAKYSVDETTGIVNFGSATKMTITSVNNIGGFTQYFYTLTHGVAPQRGQQVIVSGDVSPSHDGVFTVAQVQILTPTTGWFTTGNTAVGAGSGIAHIGWSRLVISGVSSTSGGTTYNYTKGDGLDPQVGQRLNVFDMGHAGNNGSFPITAVDIGGGTVTTSNVGGTVATEAGTASTDWVLPSGAGEVDATFQYDFPVRFDVDDLQIQLEESNVLGGNPIITWNSITLREVRIQPGQSNG